MCDDETCKEETSVCDENDSGLLLPSDFNVEKDISDAGRYSVALICAYSLHNLFSDAWDADFCSGCVRDILLALRLPKNVNSIMEEVINCNLTRIREPYILIIEEEDFIKVHSFQPVIEYLIVAALREGKYDSRFRVLIQHLVHLFNLDMEKVKLFECTLVDSIVGSTAQQSEEEKNRSSRKKLMNRAKKYALISAAALGGGALIGLTGGLAAPMIGAGLSSVIGSSIVFSAIGSTAGAAVVGSLFGVAGGGLTGFKMHKRVGDVEEFEFHSMLKFNTPSDNSDAESVNRVERQLHIAIAVPGWIKDISEINFVQPWLGLRESKEQYYLKYESSYLLELGRAMDYIVSFVATMAAQEVLKFTVFSGLITAVAWPAGLLGLASVIDNPWGVGLNRSAQVGKQLADVLLTRKHGHRSVTLLGYSLGARVIYYCLEEMSKHSNCEGIIQDVILMGAPCSSDPNEWNRFTRVVAGRIVNGYCRDDWLLQFLHRTLSMAVKGIAGLQPIKLADRRMINVDLTNVVSGHADYPDKMTQILSSIGIAVAPDESESR